MPNYLGQCCLNREDLTKLIEASFDSANVAYEEDDFKKKIEDWENWQLEFVCLATLISQYLENYQAQSSNALELLNRIISLSEEKGLFTVEFLGEEFLCYLLQQVRKESLNIEDNLVLIRDDFGNYRF